MTHVGMCTQDGPERKTGEIRLERPSRPLVCERLLRRRRRVHLRRNSVRLLFRIDELPRPASGALDHVGKIELGSSASEGLQWVRADLLTDYCNVRFWDAEIPAVATGMGAKRSERSWPGSGKTVSGFESGTTDVSFWAGSADPLRNTMRAIRQPGTPLRQQIMIVGVYERHWRARAYATARHSPHFRGGRLAGRCACAAAKGIPYRYPEMGQLRSEDQTASLDEMHRNGFDEGRNLRVDHRGIYSPDKLTSAAVDLAGSKPDVLEPDLAPRLRSR